MIYNLIVILGPTAAGKTRFAARLAHYLDGEIISADSRQVYKRMDIGTGKDYDDYFVQSEKVPCHLIDILEPGEEFNLYDFNRHFYNVLEEIKERKRIPLLVGGTGLYIHSVLKGYNLPEAGFDSEEYDRLEKISIIKLREILMSLNPELHNTTDLLIKDRIIKSIIVSGKKNSALTVNLPKIKAIVFGIKKNRDEIRKSITVRLKLRLENGLVEEVKQLLEEGLSFSKLDYYGLEYRYIGRYLKGEYNYNDMFQKLNSAIHQFAKKQMSWFRKMEKEGISINWLQLEEFESAKKIIKKNIYSPYLYEGS